MWSDVKCGVMCVVCGVVYEVVCGVRDVKWCVEWYIHAWSGVWSDVEWCVE